MAKFGDVTKINWEHDINEAQPHPKRILRYVFLVKGLSHLIGQECLC